MVELLARNQWMSVQFRPLQPQCIVNSIGRLSPLQDESCRFESYRTDHICTLSSAGERFVDIEEVDSATLSECTINTSLTQLVE